VFSVMTLRGGKERMVDHYAWHLEFLWDPLKAAEENVNVRDHLHTLTVL
jgi:hypothetical protein